MIKTTQADKTDRKRTIKYAKHKTHTRVSVPLSAVCHFWRSFCRSATCRIHWCKGAREPVVEHRADRHEHLHPNPEQQRDWRTHRHGRPQEKGQKRAAALPEIFHKVRLLMLSRQLNKRYLLATAGALVFIMGYYILPIYIHNSLSLSFSVDI